MAFYDSDAGRQPTIRNPTGGFHVASLMLDGSYRIDVLESLLPTCGRVQFVAQGYLATGGLDASQLHSLMFDTGVDCVPGRVPRRLFPSAIEDFNGAGTGGQGQEEILGGPGDDFPESQEEILGGPPDSIPVPDESSSLLLLAFSLIGVAVMGTGDSAKRHAPGTPGRQETHMKQTAIVITLALARWRPGALGPR